MIQLLDSDVDLVEIFLKRLVVSIAHRETRETALSLLRRLELARKGYPDYRKPVGEKAEAKVDAPKG